MMTPEQFEEISQSLDVVQPLFDEFCLSEEFVQQTTATGRYPRKRITKHGDINYYIDLQMDLDCDNKYYEAYTESTPFSMGLGAWLDERGERYSMRKWAFQSVPYSSMIKRLKEDLDKAMQYFHGIDEDSLRSQGEKSSVADKGVR